VTARDCQDALERRRPTYRSPWRASFSPDGR